MMSEHRIVEIIGLSAQVLRPERADGSGLKAAPGVEGFGLGECDGDIVLTLRHIDGDLLSLVLDDERLDCLAKSLVELAKTRAGTAIGKGVSVQ